MKNGRSPAMPSRLNYALGDGDEAKQIPGASFRMIKVPRMLIRQRTMLTTQRTAICVLLFSILIPTCMGQETAEPPEDGSRFHLFLLAGQSNMAGRGKVEPQDLEPHPRVLMLNQANEWVPAVDPLHFDKPKIVGVGVGKTFAIDYANANPNITVGLVPCAAGGSPISSWQPGGYHSQTKSHPYDLALSRMKHVMTSGTLKGILWHQGESDSKPKASEVYEQKLHELIDRCAKNLTRRTFRLWLGSWANFPNAHGTNTGDALTRHIGH